MGSTTHWIDADKYVKVGYNTGSNKRRKKYGKINGFYPYVEHSGDHLR